MVGRVQKLIQSILQLVKKINKIHALELLNVV